MGANFKRYVNELREKRGDDSLFPKRATLAPTTGFLIEPFAGSKKATILHIDMDCFFVSVGLRKHPELRGKPVAVAHARGVKPVSAETAELRRKEMELYRGRHSKNSSEPPSNLSSVEFASMSELASVSYEARAAGVKNGMFLGGAMKLCPEIKTIPYDFEGYNEVAYSLYDTVAEYTLDIQAVSCDEMLVDITELVQECRISPLDFAQVLRDEIFAKTKCKASVGIGPNLLLARMATRKAKPDGKFHLTEEQAPEFMKQVPVRDLPGVGRKMEAKLRDLGIQTCEELQGISLARLKAEFGAKTGLQMSQFARGEDDRALNICQERKSVSAEVNYGIRFETRADSDKFIAQLCGEVHSR